MAKSFSWIQRLISYLYPMHLESVTGLQDQTLSVYLSRGRLQLTTNQAIYSYDDLYNNFVRVFEKIDWTKLPEKSHVLLLGLGLGSVPYMLEKKFRKRFSYIVVEWDEAVIYLASEYSLQRLQSPMQILARDAVLHVLEDEDQYDLICIDLFIDDIIPDNVSDISFLEAVRDLLSPEGILVFNRLHSPAASPDDLAKYIKEVFQPVFPAYDTLKVEDNCMLISDQSYFVK